MEKILRLWRRATRVHVFEYYKQQNRNANLQNNMKICHFHIKSNAIDNFSIHAQPYFVMLHTIHSFKIQFCAASILKG